VQILETWQTPCAIWLLSETAFSAMHPDFFTTQPTVFPDQWHPDVEKSGHPSTLFEHHTSAEQPKDCFLFPMQ
jgi:hypothetical protein